MGLHEMYLQAKREMEDAEQRYIKLKGLVQEVGEWSMYVRENSMDDKGIEIYRSILTKFKELGMGE